MKVCKNYGKKVEYFVKNCPFCRAEIDNTTLIPNSVPQGPNEPPPNKEPYPSYSGNDLKK
jgi:hypothetical protein